MDASLKTPCPITLWKKAGLGQPHQLISRPHPCRNRMPPSSSKWTQVTAPSAHSIKSPTTKRFGSRTHRLHPKLSHTKWMTGGPQCVSASFPPNNVSVRPPLWTFGSSSRCCYNSTLYNSKCCEGAVHKSQQLARDLVVLMPGIARGLVILKCGVCCSTIFTKTCTCNPIFLLDLAHATTPFH